MFVTCLICYTYIYCFTCTVSLLLFFHIEWQCMFASSQYLRNFSKYLSPHKNSVVEISFWINSHIFHFITKMCFKSQKKNYLHYFIRKYIQFFIGKHGKQIPNSSALLQEIVFVCFYYCNYFVNNLLRNRL